VAHFAERFDQQLDGNRSAPFDEEWLGRDEQDPHRIKTSSTESPGDQRDGSQVFLGGIVDCTAEVNVPQWF
jgi:hypothetical protein